MRNDTLLKYAKEVAKDYEREAARRRLARLADETPYWRRALHTLSLLAHAAPLLEWLRRG